MRLPPVPRKTDPPVKRLETAGSWRRIAAAPRSRGPRLVAGPAPWFRGSFPRNGACRAKPF